MEFNTIDILGYIATILTAISSLPQVIKVMMTKSTKGTSLLMFIILLLSSVMWLSYGIALRNMPMMIGNSLSTLLNLILVTFKIVNVAKGKDGVISKKEDK